ncbi:MAG: VWA domain-containing protein [Alphaproteobacteria bacterium]|nr:VWA domain-containing protein [Alphaproteobacteria bacterium]
MNPDFHFLRPLCLWGLMFLFLLPWIIRRAMTKANEWNQVCDTHLLKHQLFSSIGKSSLHPVFLAVFGWIIAVFALAGPTWEQFPQPVFKEQTPTVIAFDLSASMDAKDVSPSRLERARFKIHDILKRTNGGQAALIVFSNEPYIVSPLTDDIKVITNMLPILNSNLMPSDGNRPDRAIDKALELLTQAGTSKGRVILLTAKAGDSKGNSMLSAKELAKAGHHLSVLGIGTTEGAPVPYRNSFIKGSNGFPVISKLETSELKQLAKVGNGRFAVVTTGDEDIDDILRPPTASELIANEMKKTEMKADVWKDVGVWLVLILVLIAPLAFRKGWLVAVVFLTLLSTPENCYAGTWENLWSRPDRQGAEALADNNPIKAAELFNNKAWKGTALYKAKKYDESAKVFEEVKGIDATYNLGNALALNKNYEKAISAYDKVLEKKPDHEDAKFNRKIVKKLLEEQKKQQQNQDKKQDKQKQDKQNQDKQKQSEKEKQKEEEKKQQAKQEQAEQKEKTEQKEEQQAQPQKKLSEDEQADKQKLSRIPDDPSALLREKIRRRYLKQRYGRQRGNRQW